MLHLKHMASQQAFLQHLVHQLSAVYVSFADCSLQTEEFNVFHEYNLDLLKDGPLVLGP